MARRCKLCLCLMEQQAAGVDDCEIRNMFGLLPSGGKGRFSQVCTACQERIRSAIALRQQVQFMDSFWNKFETEQDEAEEMRLHCQDCACRVSEDNLLEHFTTVHAAVPLPECPSFLSWHPPTTEDQSYTEDYMVEIISEPTMEAEEESKRRSHGTMKEEEDPSTESEERELLVLNFSLENTTSEALQPFPCHLCRKSYSRKDKLKHHLRKLHQMLKVPSLNVLSNYTCSTCDKRYRSQQTFDKHLLEHGPKPFQCFICTDAFAARGERRIHENSCLNLASVGHGRYICLACGNGRTFEGSDSLKQHMKICCSESDNKKDHVCSQCGASFARAHHLQIHKERSHGQSVECLKCGKSFHDRSQLKRHFSRTHNFKESLACKVCGQTLSRPDKLMEHMRLHTGFPCRICDTNLPTRREYKEHQTRHKT